MRTAVLLGLLLLLGLPAWSARTRLLARVLCADLESMCSCKKLVASLGLQPTQHSRRSATGCPLPAARNRHGWPAWQ